MTSSYLAAVVSAVPSRYPAESAKDAPGVSWFPASEGFGDLEILLGHEDMIGKWSKIHGKKTFRKKKIVLIYCTITTTVMIR